MITNLIWATLQLGVAAMAMMATAINGPQWAYWLSLFAMTAAFVAFCLAFVDYYFNAA